MEVRPLLLLMPAQTVLHCVRLAVLLQDARLRFQSAITLGTRLNADTNRPRLDKLQSFPPGELDRTLRLHPTV